MEQYLYFGSLGLHERQYQIPSFVGLALQPAHDREIKHNLTDPLPFVPATCSDANARSG